MEERGRRPPEGSRLSHLSLAGRQFRERIQLEGRHRGPGHALAEAESGLEGHRVERRRRPRIHGPDDVSSGRSPTSPSTRDWGRHRDAADGGRVLRRIGGYSDGEGFARRTAIRILSRSPGGQWATRCSAQWQLGHMPLADYAQEAQRPWADAIRRVDPPAHLVAVGIRRRMGRGDPRGDGADHMDLISEHIYRKENWRTWTRIPGSSRTTSTASRSPTAATDAPYPALKGCEHPYRDGRVELLVWTVRVRRAGGAVPPERRPGASRGGCTLSSGTATSTSWRITRRR